MRKTLLTALLCLTATANTLAAPITTHHQTIAHFMPNTPGFNLSALLYNKFYFALKNPTTGSISYTQTGNFFHLSDGFLVQRGNRLQGYPAPTTVLSNACQLSDIKIPEIVPSEATDNITININLDLHAYSPINPFNPKDDSTFNYATSTQVFDTQGNEHEFMIYFTKVSNEHWTVYFASEGKVILSSPITFDTAGRLQQPDNDIHLTLQPDSGASTPQVVAIAFTDTTQFRAPTVLRSLSNNGHETGYLVALDIDELGDINSTYTSGTTLTVAKIAVFPNAA